MGIPKWIFRLMAQDRARTRIISIAPLCPAELEKIVFVKVPFGKEPRTACANYDATRSVTEVPSPTYCPTCRYNTNNLRKEADEKLVRTLTGYVERNHH